MCRFLYVPSLCFEGVGVELITCKVCGCSYQLLNSHLRTHGLTPTEYRVKFPGAPTCTEEVRQQISVTTTRSMGLISEQLSKSQNERYARPGEREHLSEVSSLWWADKEAKGEKEKYLENSFHSKEARDSFRQLHKVMSPEARKLWCDRSFHSPEARKRAIEGMSLGLERWWAGLSLFDKEVELEKRIHSAAARKASDEGLRRRWRSLPDSEKALHAEKCARSRRPTEPEFFMGLFLGNYFPGLWVYNGDVSVGVKIGGKTPDFLLIDKSGRKIIEVFGTYYHDLEEEEALPKFYFERGYKCLVVWEYDCYLWFGYESERLALIERVSNLLGVVDGVANS